MRQNDGRPRSGGTVGLLVAVALVASASTAITAATPAYFAAAADPVVACVVPDAGVMYHAADACEETGHARFELARSERVEEVAAIVATLEATGVAGISVVSAGEVTISNSRDVAFADLPRTTAACPDEKIAVAGGYEITAVEDNTDDIILLGSRASSDGTAWQLIFYLDPETDVESTSVTMDLSVTCVTPA